jgi:hypothetical protein
LDQLLSSTALSGKSLEYIIGIQGVVRMVLEAI